MHPIPSVLFALALAQAASSARAPSTAAPRGQQVVTTMIRVQGTFDVKVAPLAGDDARWGGFDRLSLDKQFRGALEAESRGQMMAVSTQVEGSAGYVALERVTGTLSGRRGSFVLQHSGTMSGGAARMSVTVVPDSGTGELTGLSGTMTILIEGGQHRYDFEYQLP